MQVTIKALVLTDKFVKNAGSSHFKQKTSNLLSADHRTKSTCSFLRIRVAPCRAAGWLLLSKSSKISS